MCILGQIHYESILYLKTTSGCSESSRAYPGPLTDQCHEHRVSLCFPARKGQGRDSKGSLPPTDSPPGERAPDQETELGFRGKKGGGIQYNKWLSVAHP